MKGIIAVNTEVKDMMDIKSATLKVYSTGEIVQIAESTNSSGWYEVVFNNTFGYVNFEHVYLLDTKYILIESKVSVMSSPDSSSEVDFTIEYGKQFYITETVEKNNSRWIKIREFYGNTGYIPATAQFKLYSDFEEEENSLQPEEKGIRMGVLGGILMISISIIWFLGGYFFLHKIYFYPPILLIVGVFALINGIIQRNLKGD